MIDELDDKIGALMQRLVDQTSEPPDLGGFGGMTDSGGGMIVAIRPVTRVRRIGVLQLTVAAAMIVCLIGVAVLTTRGDTTRPASPPSPPAWTVATDPAGVFRAVETEPISAAPPPAGVAPRSPNEISVTGVAETSHGLIAVGWQGTGYATVAAVWRSTDGAHWTRVAHDPAAFGSSDPEREPAEIVGVAMWDVTEHDGTLVAVGSSGRQQFVDGAANAGSSDPVIWTSADSDHWQGHTLPVAAGEVGSVDRIAAGPNGLLAVGSTRSIDDTTGDSHATAWFSTDGVTWIEHSFPDASGPRYGGNDARTVVATKGGFLVGGSDDGRAIVWSTVDGSTWAAIPLPDGITDDSVISVVSSLASSNGTLVAVGTIFSDNMPGVGWRSDTGLIPPEGQSVTALWRSTDGGLTWTRSELNAFNDRQFQVAGPLAGGPSGFVGTVRVLSTDHYVETTIASTDGVQWSAANTTLTGPRRAIAATDTGWVAVGDDTDSMFPGPDSNERLRQPHSSSVWIAPVLD